jgi:hypothetical protein
MARTHFWAVLLLLVGAHSRTEKIDADTKVAIPADQQMYFEGKTQFFRIVVNAGTDISYMVARRFSEFSTLYKAVKSHMSGKDVFPSKAFTTLTKPEMLTRAATLEVWLQQAMLVLGPNSAVQQDFVNFLDPITGANSRETRVYMPADSFRICYDKRYYGITITDSEKEGKGPITIFRRYSHFQALLTSCGNKAQTFPGNVAFPPGGMFIDEDVRRRDLEAWLHALMLSPSGKTAWKKHIDEFLNPRCAKMDFLTCIAEMARSDVRDMFQFDGLGDDSDVVQGRIWEKSKAELGKLCKEEFTKTVDEL